MEQVTTNNKQITVHNPWSIEQITAHNPPGQFTEGNLFFTGVTNITAMLVIFCPP